MRASRQDAEHARKRDEFFNLCAVAETDANLAHKAQVVSSLSPADS